MTPVTRLEAPPGTIVSTVKRILWGHVGQDARISREALAEEVGARLHAEVDDRLVRRAIEELRQTDPDGALIMSSSSVDGYWIGSVSELEQANAEDLSRIDAAQRKIANRRRAIDRLSVLQPTLPMALPAMRRLYD